MIKPVPDYAYLRASMPLIAGQMVYALRSSSIAFSCIDGVTQNFINCISEQMGQQNVLRRSLYTIVLET